MFLVGLTGGIASGKSTVASMFHECGIPIIDADKIAREVVAVGCPGSDSIRKEFGDDVFHANGELNREKLGDIIFKNKRKRQLLNSIVHPLVRREMLCHVLLYALKGYNYAILDIPLLYENKKLLRYLACTIVVYCTKDQQIERLRIRNNLNESEAKLRIETQLSMEEKVKQATFIIDNSMSCDETKRQINRVRQHLHAKYLHWYIRLVVLCVFMLLALLIYSIIF